MELLLKEAENMILSLQAQNAELLDALEVFFKVVVVDDGEYKPGLPLCAGCDELTIARGWECFYKPHTTECKYPEELMKAAKVKGTNNG